MHRTLVNLKLTLKNKVAIIIKSKDFGDESFTLNFTFDLL